MEKDVALMERVANVEAQIGKHDVRLDNAEQRITAVENDTKDIHRLATAIELISHDTANTAAAMTEMKTDMKEQISGLKDGQDRLETKVTNLETDPDKKAASKFENIKNDIWKIIIAAFVGYLLAQALPFLNP